METILIPVLSEVLDSYFHWTDIRDLAEAYGIPLDEKVPSERWILVARYLLENLEHGNNRPFLDALMEQASIRSERRVVETSIVPEFQYHARLGEMIKKIVSGIGEPTIPRELSVTENQEFTAKSEVREFLEKAEVPIFIVDPFVGIGTLDCVRSTGVPIRLMTGKHRNSIEEGFDRALRDFQTEGHSTIEVRQHQKLHDRHIIFNDRCWLVGSSIKDAGKKQFNCIEIIDSKEELLRSLETKWSEADPITPVREAQ